MGEQVAGGSAIRTVSVSGLPVDPMEKEMLSVLPLAGSIARTIIRGPTKKKDIIGTGTCFVALHHQDKRCLFYTCQHNLPNTEVGEEGYVRLCDGTIDYPFVKQYDDYDRDFAVISVENIPGQLKPLEFSMDKILANQNVVLLGYRAPTVVINNRAMELVMITKPSSIPGTTSHEAFRKQQIDKFCEIVRYSCMATKGVSGSPLFRDKKVIGMHESADESEREGITANTIQKILMEWLQIGDVSTPILDLIQQLDDKITIAGASG